MDENIIRSHKGINFADSNTTIFHLPRGGLLYESVHPFFVSPDIIVGNRSMKGSQQQLLDLAKSLETRNWQLRNSQQQLIESVWSLEEKNSLTNHTQQPMLKRMLQFQMEYEEQAKGMLKLQTEFEEGMLKLQTEYEAQAKDTKAIATTTTG